MFQLRCSVGNTWALPMIFRSDLALLTVAFEIPRAFLKTASQELSPM